MAELAIVRPNGREVVAVDGFNFIKEVIDEMVSGENRRICPYCGGPKNSDNFICSDCFSKDGEQKGLEVARAVKNAFLVAGGVIEHRPRNTVQHRSEVEMIDDDFFRGIVGAGKKWKKENPDATVQQVIKHLIFVFNDVDESVVGKAGTIAHKFSSQHQTLWNNAVEVVARWYEDKPDDFRNPSEVGRDIMDQFKPEVGKKKLIAAIYQHQSSNEFQTRRKNCVFQRCESATNNYIGKTFDNRHPGEIAQEIIDNRKAKGSDSFPQSILPMLTRAVANRQDELRQAERKRLTASYSGGQKVKKPGSVAKRHNGHISKVRMAGAKKRGVKG